MTDAQEPTTPPPSGAEGAEEQVIDLAQVRVEGLMLAVASELASIGAGQLGMIPQMINGGDGLQASLAINGADALVEALIGTLPPEVEVPAQVQELRRMIAELKLAFAEAVSATEAQAGAGGTPAEPSASTPPPPPPMSDAVQRPKIWTPGGDV